MTSADGPAWSVVAVRRVGLDDHAQVRYLHARAMRAQCGDALSDGELAAFLSFVDSPIYRYHLRTEEVYGAVMDGQLIGTASWLANADDGETARIASVFVHPMF